MELQTLQRLNTHYREVHPEHFWLILSKTCSAAGVALADVRREIENYVATRGQSLPLLDLAHAGAGEARVELLRALSRHNPLLVALDRRVSQVSVGLFEENLLPYLTSAMNLSHLSSAQIDRALQVGKLELLAPLLVAKMQSASCEEALPLFERCLDAELEDRVVINMLDPLPSKFGRNATLDEQRAVGSLCRLLMSRFGRQQKPEILTRLSLLTFVSSMFSPQTRDSQLDYSITWGDALFRSPWWRWAQRESAQIISQEWSLENVQQLQQLCGLPGMEPEEWADLACQAVRKEAPVDLVMILYSGAAFTRSPERTRRTSALLFAERLVEQGYANRYLLSILGLLKYLEVETTELEGIFARKPAAREWYEDGAKGEQVVVQAWATSFRGFETVELLPHPSLPEGTRWAWIPDTLRMQQRLIKAHAGDTAALAEARSLLQEAHRHSDVDMLFLICAIGEARTGCANLLDLLPEPRIEVTRVLQIADLLDQLGADTRLFRIQAHLAPMTARGTLPAALLNEPGVDRLETALQMDPAQIRPDHQLWESFAQEQDGDKKRAFVTFALQHSDQPWSHPPAGARAHQWLSDPAQFETAMRRWEVTVPQLAGVLTEEMALDQLGDSVVQQLVPLLMRQRKWPLLTALLEKSGVARAAANWTQRPPAGQVGRIADAYRLSPGLGKAFFDLMQGHVPAPARDAMRALEFQLAPSSDAPKFFRGRPSEQLQLHLLQEMRRKLADSDVDLQALLNATASALRLNGENATSPVTHRAILLTLSVSIMMPDRRRICIDEFMATGGALSSYQEWPETEDHLITTLISDGGEEALEMLCRALSIASCAPTRLAELTFKLAREGTPLQRVLHLLTSAPPEHRAEIAKEFAESCLRSDLQQTYKQGALALLLASDQPLLEGAPRGIDACYRGADALLKGVKGRTPSAESQSVAAMSQMVRLAHGEHRYWSADPIAIPEPLLPVEEASWLRLSIESGLRLARAHAGDQEALTALKPTLDMTPESQAEKSLFASAWGATFTGLARDYASHRTELGEMIDQAIIHHKLPPRRVQRLIEALHTMLGEAASAALTQKTLSAVAATEIADAVEADGGLSLD